MVSGLIIITNFNFNLYNIIRKKLMRKYSYDAFCEQQDQLSQLFPGIRTSQISSHVQHLRERYKKQSHAFSLSNYIYRCHKKHFILQYSSFKQEYQPDLVQPAISNFYQNTAFINLAKLASVFEVQGQPFQQLYIPPLPINFKELLNQIFENYGFIPNLQRFLLFFPLYLQKHLAAERQIFQSEKIDQKIAYFLAIVAAGEKGSVYMMSRYIKKFLKSGGELNWITQAKYPNKLVKILQLARLMSNSIWEVTPQHIIQILQNQGFKWSVNQLAIIIQIIAFSNQNSTVALSMGLIPEDDQTLNYLNLRDIQEIKSKYDSIIYQSQNQNKQTLSEMHSHLIQLDLGQNSDSQQTQNKTTTPSQKKIVKKSMRKTEFIDTYMKQIGNQLTKQQLYEQINNLLNPLLLPYQFIEKRKESVYANIDYSEYNFKFMAYPILKNFTHSIADKIQNLIDYSEIMSRGNFGTSEMKQTKQFRRAVRYYGQNLCGYTHKEYNFKDNITDILTIPLKFYIRLLMISPLHINKQVIKETYHEEGQIECFDLGHLAVLIANTKMSLELTLTVQAFEL